MSLTTAAASGLIGAAAVTAINESARRAVPQTAPRMEIVGMRALHAGLQAADQSTPPRRDLIRMALAGDIVSNTAYYSMVGLARPENAVAAGTLLGLAAGIGAVLLPGAMGLGNAPSGRTPQTKAMTVAWHMLGGLAAGLTYSMFAGEGTDGGRR